MTLSDFYSLLKPTDSVIPTIDVYRKGGWSTLLSISTNFSLQSFLPEKITDAIVIEFKAVAENRIRVVVDLDA